MNWDLRPLAEFCLEVVSGGTPSTGNPDFYGGDIPWLRTQEVTFNRILDTEIKITDAGLANSAARWVPENSIIVAMYGNSAGRVAINRIPLTTNQACCNLIVDHENADHQYVYYSVKNRYQQLKALSQGAAQNNLNAGQVKAFEIPRPPIEIQRRIAAILSVYDDLIENNRRRIQLLEQAARLIYREWFVRLRFPGHEGVRVVDGVPEGWERTSLSEALLLQRGFDLPTADRREGSVPILASTGVTGTHDIAKVKGPGVVTGRSGSLGVVTFVDEDFWPLNTALWVKEFKRVSAYYARFMLSEMGLEQYNGGASVPTLDRKAVHRVSVLIPPLALIQHFDEQVRSGFRQRKILNQMNTALLTARDLLLPRLMSGQIEV